MLQMSRTLHTVLLHTVLFILLFSFQAFAEGNPVFKDKFGSYKVLLETELRDTGITMDADINRRYRPGDFQENAAWLARIIDKRESIALDPVKTAQGWRKYYTHIAYEVRSTRSAVLKNGIIRSVSQETVGQVIEFNPFLLGAFVYILSVVALYLSLANSPIDVARTLRVACRLLFGVTGCLAGVVTIFTSLFAFSAIGTFYTVILVATFSSLSTILLFIMFDYRWEAVPGAGLMVVATIRMVYLV